MLRNVDEANLLIDVLLFLELQYIRIQKTTETKLNKLIFKITFRPLCGVFHRAQFIVNEVKLKTTCVLNRMHNCTLLQKLRVAAGWRYMQMIHHTLAKKTYGLLENLWKNKFLYGLPKRLDYQTISKYFSITLLLVVTKNIPLA